MPCQAEPLRLALRVTRFNRSSLAAVLAVVERELAPRPLAVALLEDPADYDGQSLLLYSFTSLQTAAVQKELTRLTRHHGADLPAVAGGCHASALPEATLALGFRWVVPGEAGPGFARLVHAVAHGRPPESGVLPRDAPQPLDRYLPWPRSVRLRCPVEITRGCPLGCAFCQTPRLAGRRPRHRSLRSIARVFEEAVASGNTFTRFIAPNAFAYGSEDGRTPQPRAVERLLRLARDQGMQKVYLGTFPAEVRPDSVTDEMLQLVRDHCDNRTIVVGLQSGSAEVLRRLGRGHTVDRGVEAVARIARAGFRPAVDFIFGLPGEGDHDRRLTRELVRHLHASYDARINLHLFTPLPGTPLAGQRPAPLDRATRDLLDEIAGRGGAWGHVAGWATPTTVG